MKIDDSKRLSAMGMNASHNKDVLLIAILRETDDLDLPLDLGYSHIQQINYLRNKLERLRALAVTLEDCGFRMIQPHEIQAAMAFPETYKVLGNKRDKVRQLGNAVTPPVMRMLVERCVKSLEG